MVKGHCLLVDVLKTANKGSLNVFFISGFKFFVTFTSTGQQHRINIRIRFFYHILNTDWTNTMLWRWSDSPSSGSAPLWRRTLCRHPAQPPMLPRSCPPTREVSRQHGSPDVFRSFGSKSLNRCFDSIPLSLILIFLFPVSRNWIRIHFCWSGFGFLNADPDVDPDVDPDLDPDPAVQNCSVTFKLGKNYLLKSWLWWTLLYLCTDNWVSAPIFNLIFVLILTKLQPLIISMHCFCSYFHRIS